MAHLTDLDHTAPADSLKSGAQVLNTWRTRIDALNDVLGSITATEATQLEAIGSTIISAAQWAYVGAANQLLVTTASPTFNGLTLTSLTLNAAFTLGGTLTLGGTVAGGDYAWSNVGDMTFANGSILKSGSSASDTLILAANDTTCITLTTGATDKVEIVALNALTAIANLDIGSYTFTCAGLIDDTLTSGRVVFASTGGLLADDGDFLFATDTLTVTKIGAFEAAGAINFNSQNMTNVDIDSGTITGITDLAVADGGTGSSTAANARTALGVAIGSNVQAWDTQLDDIAALAVTNGNFIVGDGANWVAESGTTALASLGLVAELDNLTSGEVGQLENIGNNTISSTQWGYLGALDQGLTTSSTVTFGTINAFTLGGAVAGGDQSWTNVGDVTFAAGSVLASGNTNTDTLLLKANDTTCITLTTASTDQMDLAAVYSLVAINNLDIGVYTFTCAGLIDDSLTSGRVIFATTNGQLADDGDMTFSTDTLTIKKIVLNDATTASTDMFTLTPGGAVAAGAIWKGIYINGAALDPAGANAEIEGIYIDLSGVATANTPEMRGVYASVPAGLGYEALHIVGKIKLDNDESTLAPGETATGVDIIVSASGASGGEYHAIDVATTGTSSASLTAVATHTGIDVIHQHTGSFISPTKAWNYDDSGSSYADVTTAFGSAGTDVTIFPDDDDAIFIGADTAFDEIEVILATSASVDIKPTFWYSTAVTFIRFFPADDTEGFTQDGTIRFDADDLANFAALSVNGTSKYYIKIIRTKNNVVTDPIEDTIKTLVATECFWNNVGAVQVVSIAVPTITTVTTFTASGNLDIGAYSFRAATLLADGLTSGRVVFTTANGQLTDDSDLTFSTATLSATNVTSSGTITTAALIATAHLDIGAYNFRCNGLIDDSLTSGRVIFSTTNGQLADDSDFTFSVATLTIANISSSGTITTAGITATSNIDIGTYNFRAQNLTADALPSDRVLLTSTSGLLATDSDITFATDTLTVTKIGAFEATGAINFGNQAMTNVDINSGAIDDVTIGGSAAPTVTDLGAVTTCDINGGTIGGITFDGALTMSLGSDVDGDIYYRTSNVLTRLAKGTGLHVLRMNAGATAPEWAAGAGGGGDPLDNLCRNAAIASRSGGTSAIMDEWELEGTPTVAYATVDPGYGDNAVKFTASGAGDEGGKQTLTHLKISTKYQVFARVKVDAGDTASLITTGATTNINTDSTSATWEDITGEFITDGSGTDVVIKLVASADTDVAYFCGITCVESDTAISDFIRRVHEVIYLTTPITSTSWNGDSFSTIEADLDLSAFGNGCPAGIKYVWFYCIFRDSGSLAGTTEIQFGVGGVGIAVGTRFAGASASGIADDIWVIATGSTTCNSNGDIRYQIFASGENTAEIYLQILGYVLGE